MIPLSSSPLRPSSCSVIVNSLILDIIWHQLKRPVDRGNKVTCFQFLLPEQGCWSRRAISMFYAAFVSTSQSRAVCVNSYNAGVVKQQLHGCKTAHRQRTSCGQQPYSHHLMPCRQTSQYRDTAQYDVATWLFPTIRSPTVFSSTQSTKASLLQTHANVLSEFACILFTISGFPLFLKN